MIQQRSGNSNDIHDGHPEHEELQKMV